MDKQLRRRFANALVIAEKSFQSGKPDTVFAVLTNKFPQKFVVIMLLFFLRNREELIFKINICKRTDSVFRIAYFGNFNSGYRMLVLYMYLTLTTLHIVLHLHYLYMMLLGHMLYLFHLISYSTLQMCIHFLSVLL